MNKIATLPRQRALLALLCLMLSAGFLFGQWRVTRHKAAERLAAAPVPVRATAPVPARPTTPNPAPVAPVQSGGSYNLTQSVIPGGGGTSANGTTNVVGSVGQSAVADSSGGIYTVSGGFWPAAASGGCAANTAPVLTYSNQSVAAGGALEITPASGPGDNGSISSIVLLSQGAYTGTINVNNTTGVVALSNATPAGSHTVTLRATDNCGATTDAVFTLAVVAGGLIINSVLPPAGRVTGGQQIVLAGSFVNLTSVTVGGVAAAFSFANGTNALTVTTPAHAAGAVSIVLTPSAGLPFNKPNAFAYLPTVFTDNVLSVSVTTAKAQHILELRQAVDALRLVAGLAPAAWTDATLLPTSTVIKAVHITELRTNLEHVAALLGYAPVSYTDPVLSGLPIKRIHLEELRQRLRNIAG